MDESKKRIGELLIEHNEISHDQLNKALDLQKKTGGLLGVVLVKAGFIEPAVMAKYLAMQTAATMERYRNEKAAG